MPVAGDASAKRSPQRAVGDAAALSDSLRPVAFDRPPAGADAAARARRLATLAAKLLRCPVAEASLLSQGVELVIASYEARGPSPLARSRPLSSAAAAAFLATDAPLAVSDLTRHAGVADLDPPGGPSARSYLGVPLRGSDKGILGRLCVVDEVPREWTVDELRALSLLADEVAVELDSRAGWDTGPAAATWLELTLGASNLGRFEYDSQTRLLRCDQRLMSMLGCPSSTVVPHIDSVRDRIHSSDTARLMQAIATAIETNGDFTSGCRITQPDGSAREISVRGRVLGARQGEPVRMLGVAWDVTIERESRDELARLLETMPSAFVRTDRGGRLTALNRGAETLCRRPREALLGSNLWQVFAEPLGAELRTAYERTTTTEVAERVETYLETAETWVRVHIWPDPLGTSLFFDTMARRPAVERPQVGVGGAGEVVSTRAVTLLPELASAGAARRMLREVLTDNDREAWAESAELAVSEVVANAVLHAHTPIEMAIEVRTEDVRVEVRDSNPEMPVPQHRAPDATTGRGMALVAALTHQCGVRSLGGEGKIVWFTVGAEPPERSARDLLASWDFDTEAAWAEEEDASKTATVKLVSLPPVLWLAAQQHHDELLRELGWHFPQRDDVRDHLRAAGRPRRLLAQAVGDAVARSRRDGIVRAAHAAGPTDSWEWVPAQVDLELRVPPDLGPDFIALQDALDLAERLSVAGKLLVRPGLPEAIELRDWVCDQVVAQLDGASPTAWPGAAQPRFETVVHDRTTPVDTAWDASAVRDATVGVVAVDDANRIVAISRPLADQLGWAVADLVGRRVVTLIPPQLREAHVAGFSRHLSTGQARMIGVPLQLPVLAKDGSLVECRLLIERGPSSAGRSYYIAWIDPV
ncbi:MAG: PAS domain S-box protein [Nocardioidaceae bacterium]|nr:PAS domain S-box protein [Nocardioidaceae bacterium]